MRLHFVWVLMGCIGGFEALGLVGLVVGPVVLALARELWVQRVRDLPGARAGRRTVPLPPPSEPSCNPPIPSNTTCDVS
jgi:hypothetical protein